MQRLKEQASSSDPVTARAAALLSAMPPLDVDRLRRRPQWVAGAAKRQVAGRIRTMLALAITLGSVAAAAATVRHHVGQSRGLHVAVNSPVVSPISSVNPIARHGTADRSVGSTVAEAPFVDPAAAARVEQATAVQTSAANVRAAAATRIAASAGAANVTSAAPGRGQHLTNQSREAAGDESALIVEAVRALRRDGDAVRAQALAEEALQRYPHGAQVEEAMALAMEAASARGDLVGARRAAQRYLENYRAGRFADRAQRIALPPSR